MTEENLRLNHDTTLSRDDLTTIVSMIPDGSRILDLGTGGGFPGCCVCLPNSSTAKSWAWSATSRR